VLQVWYCSKKGYKPWLEPSKQDVKLNENGGHTVWYDEPGMLKEVEKRLGHPIQRMASDLKLTSTPGARVVYGQAKGGGHSKLTEEHMQQLRPNVAKLAELETKAQTSFFTLKRKLSVR
jgi:ATP-dependent RNA helicase DDX1